MNTEGLVLLAAWAELLVLVGLLVYFVLRHTSSDPLAESRRPAPTESDEDDGAGDHPPRRG